MTSSHLLLHYSIKVSDIVRILLQNHRLNYFNHHLINYQFIFITHLINHPYFSNLVAIYFESSLNMVNHFFNFNSTNPIFHFLPLYF